jgi:hypothetical protein
MTRLRALSPSSAPTRPGVRSLGEGLGVLCRGGDVNHWRMGRENLTTLKSNGIKKEDHKHGRHN